MSELLAKFPHPDPSVSARVIAGEAVILTMHDKTLRVLNEVGTRIWELIDGHRSGKEILELILAEYEVEAGRARSDLENFLESLAAVGIVVLSDKPQAEGSATPRGDE